MSGCILIPRAGGGGGGGGAALAWETRAASGTLSLNTMHRMQHVAGVTMTLPTAVGNTSAVIGAIYDNGTQGNPVDWAVAVGGQNQFNLAKMRLVIPFETVEFISDGTDWFVSVDGRLPVVAVRQRTTVQSIPASTNTTISPNSTIEDNAGAVSGDDLVIPRTNQYQLWARGSYENLAAGVQLAFNIQRSDGFNGFEQRLFTHSAVSLSPTPHCLGVLNLTAGQIYRCRTFHNDAVARNTALGFSNPGFGIREILGEREV